MPVSFEVAGRAVAAMNHMPFFPTDPEALTSLTEMIAAACPNESLAAELPKQMTFDRWPGPATMLHRLRELSGEKECPLCNGRRFLVVHPKTEARISSARAMQLGIRSADTVDCGCVSCRLCRGDGFVMQGGFARSCACRPQAVGA